MINIEGLIIDRYNISQATSSYFYAVPFFIGAILMPVFGEIGDHFGRRGYLLCFSSILLIIA